MHKIYFIIQEALINKPRKVVYEVFVAKVLERSQFFILWIIYR